LAAHGIFEVDGSGYRHTDASRLLRSDHPMSMRAFARLMNLPVCWTSFGALDHLLRTGAAAVEVIEPNGFFAYLQTHPAEAQIFGEAVSAKAHADIATVLDAYACHASLTKPDAVEDSYGGPHNRELRAPTSATRTGRG
jgi:C-methyltransferase